MMPEQRLSFHSKWGVRELFSFWPRPDGMTSANFELLAVGPHRVAHNTIEMQILRQ